MQRSSSVHSQRFCLYRACSFSRMSSCTSTVLCCYTYGCRPLVFDISAQSTQPQCRVVDDSYLTIACGAISRLVSYRIVPRSTSPTTPNNLQQLCQIDHHVAYRRPNHYRCLYLAIWFGRIIDVACQLRRSGHHSSSE
jgi:hypothetical protein